MGQRIPVDIEPAPGGNIRVVVDQAGQRRALLVGATIDLLDPDDTGDRYLPHFATCPQADDWRRR